MIDSLAAHRARIAAAFGSATAYDDAATVQQEIARALASRILAEPRPVNPRILELGCGTGFLTRALMGELSPARWTVSDIAPEMLDRTKTVIGDGVEYRLIDGEAVDPALGRFDLIVSNLAFQWFADLPGAVARLIDRLAPGGTLAFSTMAAGSFAEWAEALAAEEVTAGTPDYPDRAKLEAMVPPGIDASIDIRSFPQEQRDAFAFLRQLKVIGAATPAAGYRPLSPAALRRAMTRFDAKQNRTTYEVAFCMLRMNRPPRPSARCESEKRGDAAAPSAPQMPGGSALTGDPPAGFR